MPRTPARRRSGYLIFLIPGLVLSVAVVVIPLAMTIGVSLTRW
jgi:raffinose/stachyose/melibiose transport system permease protein